MVAWFKQLDRILRGEATRLPNLRTGEIDISARQLAVVLLILGMIYGLCMGSFAVVTGGWARWQQLLASMVKVPLLFFLTLLVTFPSLYVFNALVGSRLSLISLLRLLVAATAIILAVLASFGTIVAFFSFSTTSYPFMKLLNVAIFALSGLLGLVFLLQTLHRLTRARLEPEPLAPTETSAEERDPVQPPPLPEPGALDRLEGQASLRQVTVVFRIWVIVFALVGAQMGWVLRPFIGSPDKPFSWFRVRESNIFQGIFEALRNTLGG